MASGQQIAEENVRLFTAWVQSKTDDDFRNLVMRGMLSRVDIATECGFAKSALTQNPRIKKALKDLEDSLRARDVLPSVASSAEAELAAPTPQPASPLRAALDAQRLSRLEQENASQKAEIAELKRLLNRYTVIADVLAEVGRVPR